MRNFFAVVFILICVVAQAQTTSKLTFEEAVTIGLKSNVILNQQKNNLFTRDVQKTQGMANFLPGVRVDVDANHAEGLQPSANGADLQQLSVDQVRASISASMTIFNGFNTINTYNQNVNLFKAQAAQVERSKQDVIFTVTNQYLQVLLDQELLNIALENFNTQKIVLEQFSEQVNVGSRAESELYTQQAQVKNMELESLRAQVKLENDKASLAQTLQLDPAIPFEVAYPDSTDGGFSESMAIDSLYAIAISNRKDLQQAEYQIDANKSTYRASINGWLPTVSLYASYGSSYNSQLKDDDLFGNFNNQFTNVFPTKVYGVQVTIPIFDRFQTRASRVSNRMFYENSKLQRDNLEKSIKIDVKRSYNNYLTAKQAYQASETQQQAGQLALRTQQESFLLGVSNQVALAQANQTYVQAAASRAQAKVTLVFQKILLEYALGTLRAPEGN